MATATGNIVFDFKAMSDVDPFTSSEFTYLTDGRAKIASDKLLKSGTGSFTLRYSAQDATADIIRSEVEVFRDGVVGGGPAILDANHNGYLIRHESGTVFYLRTVTGGAQSLISGMTGSPRLENGDCWRWNTKFPPEDLHLYVKDFVFRSSVPGNVDAAGNKFIGVS